MNPERSHAVGRALVSLALLTGAAVGAPWILVRVSTWRFGGPAPWSGVEPPTTWSLDRVGEALSSRLTESLIADLVVRVSLTVVWMAVVVLVVTVVLEVIHQVRHDGIGLPSVRGLGWGQPLARYIATGLLVVTSLLGGNRAAATPPLPMREAPIVSVIDSTSRPTVQVIASSSADDDDERSTHAYTVAPGDSVYAIAERLAGADRSSTVSIAEEILDLNLGAVMPDGQRFTNAAYIEPGWVLHLPVSASGTIDSSHSRSAGANGWSGRHVVRTGDTLSAIAADHLGDADRWPEVWDANAGRGMVDGRTFDDPHLIVPGWEIRVPADPADAPSTAPAPEVDDRSATERSADPDDHGSPALPATTNTTTDTNTTTNPTTNPTTSTVTPTTTTTSTPTTTTTTAGVPLDTSDGSTELASPEVPPLEVPSAPAPIGLGQAVMLSAGLLGLIAAIRGRRLRSAQPGVRVPAPRPVPASTERILRSVDAGERLLRLDLALRAVATEMADRDRQVLVARLAPDGTVILDLTGPCELSAPWIGSGDRWSLPAGVPVDLLAPDARRAGAPCVALVQLGVTSEGDEVFVDLEAVGTLAVDASSEQVEAVVAGMAVTLGSSPFAEVARLIGVGVPSDVFAAHRHVDIVDHPDEALALAADLIGSTGELDESTFAVRARIRGGEAWEPAVVVIGPRAFDRDMELAHLRPGRGIAAVLGGPVPAAGARLVGCDGGWRLEIMAGRPADAPLVVDLVPVGLTDAEVRAVGELIEDASMLLEPGSRDSGSVPGATVGVPADAATDGTLLAFPDADGDADEPAWSIMVRVLGPVEVVDREFVTAEFEKSKTRELIAWLATHRERSTRTGARTALWELDVRDVTFANVVSAARRTMARLVAPPDGEEWLSRTQTEQLPLHPGVVTDADVLAGRLEASRRSAPAVAVEVLGPALDLVRGMPFEGTSYSWPDAEGLTSNLVLLATTAATELAEHHLALGDVQGVFRATGQGLLVLPGHEELIALRMRAHACVGDHAGVRHEWESYERVVTSDPWSDGEPAPKLVELRRELLSPPVSPPV